MNISHVLSIHSITFAASAGQNSPVSRPPHLQRKDPLHLLLHPPLPRKIIILILIVDMLLNLPEWGLQTT